MKDNIDSNINILLAIKNDSQLLSKIEDLIKILTDAIKKRHPILVFGNGGSASDALHISGELVGRFNIDREPYNVICLNSNVTIITAWSNDVGYDTAFSRQVEAHGFGNGIIWGLSTSGNSKNVINAFKSGKKIGMKTIAFTGLGGGELAKFSDILIEVPSNSTPQIQEVHTVIYHYVCAQIEKRVK